MAEEDKTGERAWKVARAKRGTMIKVAAALSLSRAAVGQWKRVPADHVKRVADVLNVSRRSLRPDLY